jgi:hypothetical protein
MQGRWDWGPSPHTDTPTRLRSPSPQAACAVDRHRHLCLSRKEMRNYFRGTSAHNTLRVDRRDQSEVPVTSHGIDTRKRLHHPELYNDMQVVAASRRLRRLRDPLRTAGH